MKKVRMKQVRMKQALPLAGSKPLLSAQARNPKTKLLNKESLSIESQITPE
jgi:hypothetical protein